MTENKNLPIIVAATAVVMAGAGFVGGMKYQQTKQPAFQLGQNRQAMMGRFDQRDGQGTARQGMGQGQGFRPVAGEIISQDDKSITVKAQDGSSKIVILSADTKINKADEASKDDLKTGETVSVFGTTNSDGSMTAQSIQLGAMFRNMITK
jgi:hypothetical protein